MQTDTGFEKLPHLDTETKYRLQERCADRAKKYYEEAYAALEEEFNRKRKQTDPYMHSVYESHYNLGLNKCFILAQLKYFPIHLAEEKTIMTYYVEDVNTRQQYAWYTGSIFHGTIGMNVCEVHGSACNSESEWWLLVKPYIEELASP